MDDEPLYVISLNLDEEGAARAQALTRRLREGGIEPGLPGEIPPHITLAAFGQIDLEVTVAILQRFFRRQRPAPLRFEQLGSFPGTGVLHTAPVVTPDLLALHGNLHAALDAATTASRPYYRPGQWNPHCTLAEHLSPEQLADAFRLALAEWSPFTARLVELTLLVPPPAGQTLYTLALV